MQTGYFTIVGFTSRAVKRVILDPRGLSNSTLLLNVVVKQPCRNMLGKMQDHERSGQAVWTQCEALKLGSFNSADERTKKTKKHGMIRDHDKGAGHKEVLRVVKRYRLHIGRFNSFCTLFPGYVPPALKLVRTAPLSVWSI